MLKERPLTRASDGPFFVARAAELDRTRRAIQDQLNVVITGSAGSGKTSLLAQAGLGLTADRHNVYATGTDSAWDLAEAIAEDVAGPVTTRSSKYDAMMSNVLGTVEAKPTARGRVVSAIERLADYLEPNPVDESFDPPLPVILVDNVGRKAAHDLFAGYAALLSRVEAIWVVCVQGSHIDGPTNPAPAFFDEHINLGPISLSDATSVIMSRTAATEDDITQRLRATNAESFELRALIGFVRQLESGVPVGREDFEQRRRSSNQKLHALGRPAAMLVAEMQHLGAVSPSDERLLNRMGWKRARASEILSKLHKADLVRFTEQPGPDGGRPRRLYELIPELQS